MRFEVNPAEKPNIVGEILRATLFDCSKGFGGYDTFELCEGVQKLPSVWDPDLDADVQCAEFWVDDTRVEAQWYYDHDGTIEFIFEDGSSLVNYDCKKNYNWEFIG